MQQRHGESHSLGQLSLMASPKTLHHRWNFSVDQAIEAEAQAQAICMQTSDFHRAYNAFVDKTSEFAAIEAWTRANQWKG